MPDNKENLRQKVKDNLALAMEHLNAALRGERLDDLEESIARLGRAGLPHWYEKLKAEGVLPNLDGKTIGSVLELLFVAVLEQHILNGENVSLKINPARGVDLPDLDLGVKSPSENFCTSEPFFSAYERLYGNEYDCIVMLTDYQTAKKHPPLKLKILSWRYMSGSQIADRNLCAIARKHKDWLCEEGERAKRVFKFLAYVNQSDWRAKQLLKLVAELNKGDEWIDRRLQEAAIDFARVNKKKLREEKELIAEYELDCLQQISGITPRYIGVIDALENWMSEVLKDACRAPNDNEWKRLLSSPLDGQIGMSFALQWRYNFKRLFGVEDDASSLFEELDATVEGEGALVAD